MVGSVNICMGFSIKDPRFNALSPPIKKRKWIKTRLHYIRPYSSSFSTVQVYINSEFPVLTDSIKYISQECRQEAKEQILIWRDLKGLTDIDLIHSKLIYIVQGRVIGIKNNSIQFKCTYTNIAKYFFEKMPYMVLSMIQGINAFGILMYLRRVHYG